MCYLMCICDLWSGFFKVNVGFLHPIQPPVSYKDKSSVLSFVGVKPIERLTKCGKMPNLTH